MGIDLGLLILRIGIAGILCFGHGLGKLNYFSPQPVPFADPLGVGPTVSLVLTLFAEFACSFFVLVGFRTKLFAIPTILMFLVIIFRVHAHDPWHTKEFALLYLIPFVTLALAGAGRFSVDQFVKRR